MKTLPEVRRFEVEELAAGWIRGERRRALVSRLEAEPGGTERLDRIARSNEDILAQYPPRATAALIEARYRENKPSRSALRLVLPTLAAASAAAVAIWFASPMRILREQDPANAPAVAVERILVKGAPQLVIHRLDGAKTVRMSAKQEVAAGDRLQIEYNAAEARYGIVFSVDGRGAVSLHHPSSTGESTALASGGAHALPFSYELDDAPGFERFFLVWSQTPIPTGAVLAAAARLGTNRNAPLLLPDGLDAVEILLLKKPTGRNE